MMAIISPMDMSNTVLSLYFFSKRRLRVLSYVARGFNQYQRRFFFEFVRFHLIPIHFESTISKGNEYK